LHDAVLGVRLRAARILLGRQAEQEDAGDPHARDVLHVLHHLVDREPELAGHRADGLAHAAAVDDEERIDEVVDRQRGLADQLAQQRLLAQTSRTEHCMRHHTLLLGRRPAFHAARTTPSSIRRVWYAGTSATAPPRRRSSTASTWRVSFARGKSTRSPGPMTARSRSTSASARYSDGTISGRTPCSASASAVAGPI